MLKKEDADTISKYLRNFNIIRDFQTTGFQEAQEEVRKTMMLLINVKACQQLFNPELKGELLFSHDKALLNECFNKLIKYKGFTIAHLGYLKEFSYRQIQVLKYFKDKYHFE